ncbi:type III-A CRISPR-associated protein Csm2 [Nostoc sp. TCL240-02]|uniref:type III-A CRISPR-associated protein Csm2 n=1 Tax=Nostoc sp. TCL240-02 TaxID=2572090 RepID=UPI00157F8258|nr:type III-A CRISPR-associated protein Csm2 [Nostoc sp. TCL240-02]QKQ75772.1 type III-A CRISPR-associated protein Csm2 [Nostoc sp. TCL240-02]
MTNQPNRPKPSNSSNIPLKSNNSISNNHQPNTSKSAALNPNIEKEMKDTISSNELSSLKEYSIKKLVEQAKDFGYYLKDNKLETNQIRKFLDAINQLKSRLVQEDNDEIKKAKDEKEKEKLRFARIQDDIIFLQVKLTWSAARQKAAQPFCNVMSEAINKIHSTEDFYRLVQLIEAIIAYHKEAENKKTTTHNRG